MLKLGYLGPLGTFSAQAAIVWGRGQFELVGFDSIPDLLEAFTQGRIDRAIVPLENVLGDVVRDTIDFLMARVWTTPGLRITQEVLIPIRQMLLAKPQTELSAVTEVLSHPQGLAQCSEFLRGRGWKQSPVASTALAAELVSQAESAMVAAISSEQAAEQFGLKVLAADIGDSQHNVTRFIVLGGPRTTANGKSKTTLFFSTRNEPGALYHALGVFYYQGLNLSRITSYTTKRALGECYFWIDVDGHESDPVFAAAVMQLKERFVSDVVVVGSYPKAEEVNHVCSDQR
ncbi:MAG: prephenate dehydratase [Patescibacteria group bacterium]|jgi:prephenate dehydratase